MVVGEGLRTGHHQTRSGDLLDSPGTLSHPFVVRLTAARWPGLARCGRDGCAALAAGWFCRGRLFSRRDAPRTLAKGHLDLCHPLFTALYLCAPDESHIRLPLDLCCRAVSTDLRVGRAFRGCTLTHPLDLAINYLTRHARCERPHSVGH